MKTLAHVLHDHEGGAVTHDVFAQSGGPGGADFVVDVEPTANDGGVSDATRKLAAPSAGGASAGDVAFGVKSEEGDGVVIILGAF